MPLQRFQILSKIDSMSAHLLLSILSRLDAFGLSHGLSVAEVACLLAEKLDSDPVNKPSVYWMAGLVHDIGNLGVPMDLLKRVGKISADERGMVNRHTRFGAYILERMFDEKNLAQVALHHHERFDGSGIPHQLNGERIPPMARIVAVADVYDIVRSKKKFGKRTFRHEDAVEEIRSGAGTQFDPEVVTCFLRHAENIRVRHRNARKTIRKLDLKKFLSEI